MFAPPFSEHCERLIPQSAKLIDGSNVKAAGRRDAYRLALHVWIEQVVVRFDVSLKVQPVGLVARSVVKDNYDRRRFVRPVVDVPMVKRKRNSLSLFDKP
jgi:hypothetical protein